MGHADDGSTADAFFRPVDHVDGIGRPIGRILEQVPPQIGKLLTPAWSRNRQRCELTPKVQWFRSIGVLHRSRGAVSLIVSDMVDEHLPHQGVRALGSVRLPPVDRLEPRDRVGG